MRGFVLSDFPDIATYELHHRGLNNAQGVADQLLKVWEDITRFTRRNPGMYYEIQRILHDVAQVGYESALGMPHRASDYDITPATLSDRIKCQFCTHRYLVHGEPECSRKKAGLSCKLEVREYLE